MKKQLLELGICAIISLSFFGILATANDQSLIAQKQSAIESAAILDEEPSGSQGGAPNSETISPDRVSDNEKKQFSACVLGSDSKLYLSLESGTAASVYFEIFDASGKMVYHFPDEALAGQNIYQISMKYAVPGVYFIKATTQGYSRVAKVSKIGTTA